MASAFDTVFAEMRWRRILCHVKRSSRTVVCGRGQYVYFLGSDRVASFLFA